jgi:cytochrome c553
MRSGPTNWLWILAFVTVSCKGERPPPSPPVQPPPTPTVPIRAPARGDDARGARLYEEHCSSCHGEDRRGDGRARGRLAAAPRNLTDRLFLALRGDGAIARTVLQGGAASGLSKEMPRFAGELSEQDALDIAAFLHRGGVALEDCLPGGTHFLEVGPRGGPDVFLAAYGSSIPEGGQPVLLREPEQVPLDARKLGFVMLTELPLPRGTKVAAAIVADGEGRPTSVRLALPPPERAGPEAELTRGLAGHAPVLQAIAAGRTPPGYRGAGVRGEDAGRP